MKNKKNSLNSFEKVSDEYSLVVNCAGEMCLPMTFTTLNQTGRVDFYFLYLVQGNMDVLTRDGWQEATPGTAVVFYPDKPYSYRNRKSETIKYYFIHFTGAHAEKIVKECGFDDATLRFVGIREKLLLYIDKIRKEHLGRTELYSLSCCQGLMELLLSCKKYCDIKKSQELFKSIDYINRNYASAITVEELAELEHLSSGRFRTVFKQEFGISPKDYITKIRINKSMELLKTTNLSVGEISELVGFGDQLYFSRIFRKKIGASPLAYRKE